MNRIPIRSSHLKSIGHDEKTNTLEVEFQNGRVYQHANVNRSAYHQILAMPSSGGAFHRIIKARNHPATEIK